MCIQWLHLRRDERFGTSHPSEAPGALAMQSQRGGQPKFEVVAAIAGRGFKVRREDM